MQIIESLRIITEALIWSDQNSIEFFPYLTISIFESHNVLGTYSKLLRQDFERTVIIQLLQSANILIHNLKNEDSKSYLLKNQFYKEILSHPFDFTDDEIIENYMSLIKGLAVNLPISQLRDYLIENHYALFTAAMMFFNYQEALVKTASRTVVLRVLTGNPYSVQDEAVEKFIWESGFFHNLISNVKESIMSIMRSTVASNNISKLEQQTSEFLDLLYHINDIFDLNRETVNIKLCDILLKVLVLPILACSIIEEKPKYYHIPISIALYSLAHLISIVKFPMFTNTLLELLFAKTIPLSFHTVMVNPPNRNAPLLEKSPESISNVLFPSLMSFLKCKEDNLIGLSLSIIQSVFSCSISEFFANPELPAEEIHENFMEIFNGIILAEEELRFFSCFLACKLFYEIFKAEISFNKPSVFRDVAGMAKKKHAEILANSLNVKNSEIIKKFEQEWEFVRNLKWNEHLELPLNYILHSIDEFSSMIPLQNRRNHTEEDFLRTEIRLFFLYRKLDLILNGASVDEVEKKPFKAFDEPEIRPGKSYSVKEAFLKERVMIKVYEKGFNKTVKYIFQDNELFIFGTLNSDGSVFNAEIVMRFSKIETQMQSEPNIEVLIVEGHSPLVLFFEQYFEWMSFKNKLEKKIKECKLAEINEITNFLMQAA